MGACHNFFGWKKKWQGYEYCSAAQYGNYGTLLSGFFGKNFVKATNLLKEIRSLNSWFGEIFKFLVFTLGTYSVSRIVVQIFRQSFRTGWL